MLFIFSNHRTNKSKNVMPKHGSNDRNFHYPYKHPSLPAEVRHVLPKKNIKKTRIPQEFKAIVSVY